MQKSAEGIVVPFDRSEGPNVKYGLETRISMTKGDAERRAEKLESHPEGSRRKRREEGLGASRVTARREDSGPETEQLLEAVVERENMWRALKQVERNKGAAGVDKITVGQLRAYLREHWLRIK